MPTIPFAVLQKLHSPSPTNLPSAPPTLTPTESPTYQYAVKIPGDFTFTLNAAQPSHPVDLSTHGIFDYAR